ncbi:MAG: YvcK family protein [Acidimicrobiia bacterium]|nr:YvcK family protein [Acidimicrobiia bacterium]
MSSGDLPGTGIELEPDPLMQALASSEGPSVVAVGGGHGLAQAVLACQRYAGTLSALVTVADDGGSSGRLVPDLDIPAPGDIRRCLIAMSPEPTTWRRLFDYRFDGSDVAGHLLGNLLLVALHQIEGTFEDGLRTAERLLGTVGSVIPAAAERVKLEAVVDGSVVEGQVSIALSRGNISKIRILPGTAAATDRAREAIRAADQIVLGPGSLYTSVIAPLLVSGVVEAINDSGARLVYVANVTTQDGETLGMDAADHLEALLSHTGVRPPSTVIANRLPVAVEAPIERLVVDEEALATFGVDVVWADLLDTGAATIRHDPVRLGLALAGLV